MIAWNKTLTSKGKTHEKKLGVQNLSRNYGFRHCLKFGSFVFLNIAQYCSLGQCLTLFWSIPHGGGTRDTPLPENLPKLPHTTPWPKFLLAKSRNLKGDSLHLHSRSRFLWPFDSWAGFEIDIFTLVAEPSYKNFVFLSSLYSLLSIAQTVHQASALVNSCSDDLSNTDM